MNNNLFFLFPKEAQPLFILLLIVDVILKGITLYKSARRDQKVWFVALLLVNSLGILPIVYLFIQKDIQFQSTPAKATKKKSRKSKN